MSKALVFQSVLAICNFLSYCQHTVFLIESGVRLESKSAYFHLPCLVNVHIAVFMDVKSSLSVQYYKELSSIFLF